MDFFPRKVPCNRAVADDQWQYAFPFARLDCTAPWGFISGKGTADQLRLAPCRHIDAATVIAGTVPFNDTVRHDQG